MFVFTCKYIHTYVYMYVYYMFIYVCLPFPFIHCICIVIKKIAFTCWGELPGVKVSSPLFTFNFKIRVVNVSDSNK